MTEEPGPLDAAIEAKLRSACVEGRLLDVLREEDFFYDAGGVEPIGTLIAGLHNDGAFDLLATYSPANLRSVPADDFFDAQVAFCEAVPHLECDVRSLAPIIVELVRLGGADAVATRPFTVFRRWLQKSRQRTEDALVYVMSDLDADRGILRFALSGLASFDRAAFFEIAMQLVNDARPHLALGTLNALSDIDVSDQPNDAQRVMGILRDAARNAPDDDFFANALGALLAQHRHDSIDEDLLVEILAWACVRPSPGVRYILAGKLLRVASAVPASAWDGLIALFATIPSTERTTLQLLDGALARASWPEHRQHVVKMVDAIVGRNDDAIGMTEFKGLLHRVQVEFPERGAWLIVALLLSGSRRTRDEIRCIADHGEKIAQAAIDLEAFALDDDGRIQLCDLALGYLPTNPSVATNLVTCLLQLAGPDAVEDLSRSMFRHLLLNFPGLVDDITRRSDQADPVLKDRLEAVLREYAAYMKALEAMPVLKELRPSERQRHMQHARQDDFWRDVHRIAQEESIFANLVHRSVLLYGSRSVTYVYRNRDEAPERAEIGMTALHHSFDWPRMEVLDPVGYQLGLLQLRGIVSKR